MGVLEMKVKEYYCPIRSTVFKIHSFKIQPVKYRRIFYNYLGELVKDYCLKCNKEIAYGDNHFKGYKNRNDEFVIRQKCAYGQFCFNCGIEILKSITPNKLLKVFNKERNIKWVA